MIEKLLSFLIFFFFTFKYFVHEPRAHLFLLVDMCFVLFFKKNICPCRQSEGIGTLTPRHRRVLGGEGLDAGNDEMCQSSLSGGPEG